MIKVAKSCYVVNYVYVELFNKKSSFLNNSKMNFQKYIFEVETDFSFFPLRAMHLKFPAGTWPIRLLYKMGSEYYLYNIVLLL